MSLGPLYVLLREVAVHVLCPLFIWIVCLPGVESCEFFVYFGDQTLIWGIICKYVSHVVGSLFILMLFSLVMQKLFILMRSHLFIISFMSLALGDISLKILLHGMSDIFLPMFSSGTLMVSRLIFKSFIHLEFIFVYGVSWWLSFFLSFFGGGFSCPDLPTPFDEEAIFTPFYALPPLLNINWP